MSVSAALRCRCAAPPLPCRVDLYIAHYPAALPAVATAARKYGTRYAYDAEDFHIGDWPDDAKYDGERRLVREIESRYLQGCAYVTAASPGIAEAYVDTYGIKRPRVVLNAFPLGHALPNPTPQGTVRPRPSLYWFSQTIGPDRGLECAVRAIALDAACDHTSICAAHPADRLLPSS